MEETLKDKIEKYQKSLDMINEKLSRLSWDIFGEDQEQIKILESRKDVYDYVIYDLKKLLSK